MSRTDRRLLQVPALELQVNATVAQDGSGQYKTIGEALMHVPSHGSERYVVYVKAGVYEENVLLYKEKTNVMLLGDGRDHTIVASSKNVKDGYTTFASATFAASGKGFIARDITFANFAGPHKNQAVALRVGADLSAFYRTITAQGRNDPNQNTGFSIQNCSIVASKDLAPVRSTYLGKPWKLFSRTVIIQSFLGDVVHPAGWLEWVIRRVEEVNVFSVDNFISGATWLPSSGIPFDHEL
ncbi:hypothetical protein SUGI_0091620 [Cryptomeria japonica]|nr:hypothetical protein SUGI_0091620 [Cryptomeria japonica]